MTNWRFVNRERTGTVWRLGKTERITCGIVSPAHSALATTERANAQALTYDDAKSTHSYTTIYFSKAYGKTIVYSPPNAKANWKNDTAARPLEPKQWFMIPMYEFWPLIFAFMTMRRIVQSVTPHSTTNSIMPVTNPACLTAYGSPETKGRSK